MKKLTKFSLLTWKLYDARVLHFKLKKGLSCQYLNHHPYKVSDFEQFFGNITDFESTSFALCHVSHSFVKVGYSSAVFYAVL